jgi:predicted Zn-dependent protease
MSPRLLDRLWRNLVPRYNTNYPMTEQKKTRRQLLEEFVAREPNDSFSRYGLALECSNSGDASGADLHFRELLERNVEYVPGYLMYAQFLVKQSRTDEARAVLNTGITVAERKGDAHARSEMESLFSELS